MLGLRFGSVVSAFEGKSYFVVVCGKPLLFT
mgnify:CR=1 FL=1